MVGDCSSSLSTSVSSHTPQLQDPATPLHSAYSAHLAAAASCYNELLCKLEAHYRVSPADLDSSASEGEEQSLLLSCWTVLTAACT